MTTGRSPIGELRLDDDVLWHVIAPGTTIRHDDAIATWEAIAAFVGDRRFAAVVDTRGVTFASRAVRDEFSEPPEGVNEIATALIVGARHTVVMGSLFLRLSRPARPTRLFADPDNAVDWARSQL